MFDVLINSLRLVVNFEIKDRKKLNLNFKSFAEELLYDYNKL